MRLLIVILIMCRISSYAQNTADDGAKHIRLEASLIKATDFVLSDTTVDFGELYANEASMMEVHLQNKNDTAIFIDNVTFSSVYFKLYNPPAYPFKLEADSNYTFMLLFFPLKPGQYEARAEIQIGDQFEHVYMSGKSIRKKVKSPSKDFSFHPNPAKDFIRVHHTNKTPKHYHLFLRNTLGDHVYTFYESRDAESDLDLFARVPDGLAGQYFLVLVSGEEEVESTLEIE